MRAEEMDASEALIKVYDDNSAAENGNSGTGKGNSGRNSKNYAAV